MGVETSKAVQARRREHAARVERLIAKADERCPIGSARRARIQETGRLARRRMRALVTAQQAVSAIEVEIGRALLRAVDDGLSRNEAFELVGLRRHLGRKYVERALTAQDRVRASSSTDPSRSHAAHQLEDDGERTDAGSGTEATGRRL